MNEQALINNAVTLALGEAIVRAIIAEQRANVLQARISVLEQELAAKSAEKEVQ